MATCDVPGANPNNNDELHPGCWAEADDNSLIYVEGVSETENIVIYSIFDLTDPNNPLEFRDSMPIDGFEQIFKNSPDTWTWHDKTAFPWQKIMSIFKDGSKVPSADQLISAAQRIVKTRKIYKSNKIKKDDIKEKIDNSYITKTGHVIIDKIQRALNELRK